MKRFLVTTSTDPDLARTGVLSFQGITADYMNLENGHLIFRKEVRGGYPETLRVFAPGSWLECKLLLGAA